MLKCLDCLFGLSLFFVVVLCHQGGEDTCREPTEAHARSLLGVPPAGFWSRGGGQESEDQTKLLWDSLGAPGVAELSPAPRGRCHTHCTVTVVFAATAPGLIPALPTETKWKFHHRTLLKSGWIKAMPLSKDLVITETPFQLNCPLLPPTWLLFKAVPPSSAGGSLH